MFGKCSETFVKPSEQFWKIFGNLRKVVGNLHGRLEIWNLSSRVHIRYLTRSLRSLVRYQCEHSKINSISPPAHVLFSIYSPSLAFDSAHVKYGVWPQPKFMRKKMTCSNNSRWAVLSDQRWACRRWIKTKLTNLIFNWCNSAPNLGPQREPFLVQDIELQ